MSEPLPSANVTGPQNIVTGVAPPHSVEAEMSVLGAILLSDRSLGPVVDEEGLRPEHFYRERHRLIFAAMCEMLERAPDSARASVAGGGSLVDVLTVTEWLRSTGRLEEVGGKAAVDELTGGVPGLGGVRRYAQIVKRHWVKRRQLSATYEMQAGILNHDEEQYQAGLHLAENLVVSAPGEQLLDLDAVREHMLRWLSEKRESGFPLPWPGLQRILRLRRGHTTVVSGWTNVGKSHVAFQIAQHVGRKLLVPTDDGGTRPARIVAWINEQNREEHWARQLTRDSAVPYEDLLEGEIDKHQHLNFQALLKAVSQLSVAIVEAHGWPAEEIARHMRQVRPDLAVVDHFHQLPGVSKTEDADAAVQALTSAASRADCHLLLVSQLNQSRSVGSERPAPVLRDLRGTGQLQSLPSNILFVHRDPDEDDGDGSKSQRMHFGLDGHLDVAKQRGGRVGIVPVQFKPATLTFNETVTDTHASSRGW